MKMFRKDEEAVSPVIGVILMVAITVILAAVIAAFVFGLGGSQQAAPTASIVAQNNADTSGSTMDMKIVHRGGDTLKAGEWKVSVVDAATGAPAFATGNQTFGVGNQIAVTSMTTIGMNATNSSISGGTGLTSGTRYDVKLVHTPTNAMLLDTVVEVR